MNQTHYPCKGPQCFGNSKRISFVDIRDEDIPGPGSHNSSRADGTTKWTFGRSTHRDSFLEKYPIPNPSPLHYKPNAQPTLSSEPQYSIPRQKNSNPGGFKDDDICTSDYNPNLKWSQTSSPFYSFGYVQETDYSTAVPPANNYQPTHIKNKFNKTQHQFTRRKRPLPEGEARKYPGVGAYSINNTERSNGSAYAFGTGPRSGVPEQQNAPGRFYDIGREIKQPGKGYTMRPYYDQVKGEKECFPGPNHYNPKYLDSRKKIISFTSKRSQLYNESQVKYPDPQQHITSPEFYKTRKSLSFTKQSRQQFQPEKVPGPGKYDIGSYLNTSKGYIGKKIKALSQSITPAADNYRPKDDLTKPTPQRTISFWTGRTDFSKSITGLLGPGVYEVNRMSPRQELGKMSKSLKFEKNRNKNPGPGFYEIPGTIGRLPKYYCAKRKLTTTGFSTHALMANQRQMQRIQQLQRLKCEQLQQQKVQQQQQQNDSTAF